MTDDEFAELVSVIEQGTLLVVLDACHAGGFAKDVISAPRRLGMFSSHADCLSQVASDLNAGGYLSRFFIEAISTHRDAADADGDGRLTVIELNQYVYHRYRDLVASKAAFVPTPARFERVIAAQDLSRQQVQIDRGGVGAHEVLFGW